ncbi:type II toxin-antitoxin system VapC family toxin [Granulicella mallensis]|uniref:Ribonuclease VapC n=1 Tax=Granulicella mallensis (strain ATCC BAA-1857 / DSM 23137 / MP5ACTX8) TaxID=682795 RepID=G8NU58_GRAMM|nr:type II toxin-antitoxin system VapC family toxin [Granulicella mallensis]AEU38693.1 PilT protein domain protein [Granulicella mallensis MP5ACTX8]
MIILDTNVVSEPMRPNGDPRVGAWLDRQMAETLYLTATSLSELLVGVELLPEGKRKQGLASALSDLMNRLFGSRILPFDQQAAITYASLIGQARIGGHHLSVADGQIAAIAKVHGFIVATRDTTPFVAAGISILNPWEE